MKDQGFSQNKIKSGFSERVALISTLTVAVLLFAVVFMAVSRGEVALENSSEAVLENTVSHISDDGALEDASAFEEPSKEQSEETDFKLLALSNTKVSEGTLILVNNENTYELPDENVLLKVYDSREGYLLATGEERLLPVALEKANGFLGSFAALSGKKNVLMRLAYVDHTQQKERYEDYLEGNPEDGERYGVRAGGSDHHTGLSFNLMLYQSSGKIGEGEYEYLLTDAYKYGFVLRYPSEKLDITGVIDDNHFRYVGEPHAEYMYKNNLCLEEYLKKLKEEASFENPITLYAESGEYKIYYAFSDFGSQTEIKVPLEGEVSVSGDNCGGFVVTVKS